MFQKLISGGGGGPLIQIPRVVEYVAVLDKLGGLVALASKNISQASKFCFWWLN